MKYLPAIKPTLIWLLLIATALPRSTALIEDVIEVFRLGKEVLHTVTGAWEIVDQTSGMSEIEIPFLKKREKKILKRMNGISNDIHLLEKKVLNSATWTIESINSYMKLNTKLELTLHELSGLMNRIAAQEMTMRDFTEHQDTLEKSTLEDFATLTVSASSIAIQGLLDRIHLLVTGAPDFQTFGNNGILKLIAADMEEARTSICATRQSAQLILYQIYNAISLTELKGYAMMQFSWMLLKMYGRGNFTTESSLMRKRFDQRTTRTHLLLRKVMERADKAVWRCDPEVHIQDETYTMFTGLMQGYIENEVDLNNDNTCRENCGHYQLTESFTCYKDLYCARQPRCSGKLLNCRYVDSDMWICPSKSSSHRRYEYIEYENGKILGKHGTCTRGTTKVDSWWRWLFWHCSYCLCHCDEKSARSDRYFNLRESLAITAENRVVTGMRFVKKNRIIHLQIQEGELLPRGHVNQSTTRWRPISDYTLLDRGVREGVDYHTVKWDSRAIDLDDLMAPVSHVVTGVRFRMIGSHINFEIRITEMDFVKGLLNDQTSIWVSNDNTDASPERRTELILYQPDVPTTNPKSLPLSRNNQYVQFSHSDVDLDAAQSTIPYFDAQDVVSVPAVPLSGAGIYQKGKILSGGFVAPKIFTYDYGPHIQAPEVKKRKRRSGSEL